MKPGEVLLLENLRYYAEEEGKPRGLADDASDEEKKAAKAAVKESQKKFVADLASLGDVWINDAFGTAHRSCFYRFDRKIFPQTINYSVM